MRTGSYCGWLGGLRLDDLEHDLATGLLLDDVYFVGGARPFRGSTDHSHRAQESAVRTT